MGPVSRSSRSQLRGCERSEDDRHDVGRLTDRFTQLPGQTNESLGRPTGRPVPRRRAMMVFCRMSTDYRRDRRPRSVRRAEWRLWCGYPSAFLAPAVRQFAKTMRAHRFGRRLAPPLAAPFPRSSEGFKPAFSGGCESRLSPPREGPTDPRRKGRRETKGPRSPAFRVRSQTDPLRPPLT